MTERRGGSVAVGGARKRTPCIAPGGSPSRIVRSDPQDPPVSIGATHATPVAERDEGARSLTIVGCRRQVASASGHYPTASRDAGGPWPSVTEVVVQALTHTATEGARTRYECVGPESLKPILARHTAVSESARKQYDGRRSGVAALSS